MDETAEKVSTAGEDAGKVPESPKPMAFTIDFGGGKAVDTQRFKTLVEKYQSRHKRGQSLSKFEEAPSGVTMKRHPLTGNLPRKSSFHSEGYYSSDEKDKFRIQGARSTVLNSVISKGDLTLPLKNVTSDRIMTQSFPNRSFDLPSINSPEIELKDISSPELDDIISPISPLTITQSYVQDTKLKLSSCTTSALKFKLTKQHSSPEVESKRIVSPTKSFDTVSDTFVNAVDYDFEKADTISDAGTYTLDGDNYTEEQKARMSIDKFFNIEHVSDMKKTQEYIQSLQIHSDTDDTISSNKSTSSKTHKALRHQEYSDTDDTVSSNKSTSKTQQRCAEIDSDNIKTTSKSQQRCAQIDAETKPETPRKTLLTTQPTTVQSLAQKQHTNAENKSNAKKVFNKNKVMFPTVQKFHTSTEDSDQSGDQGVFTSVTASGVLSKGPERRGHARRSSLVQSEIFVEAYTGDTTIKQPYDNVKVIQTVSNSMRTEITSQQNDVTVQYRLRAHRDLSSAHKRRSLNLDETSKGDLNLEMDGYNKRVSNLPPTVGGLSGKNSPTKIPSPVHSLNRARSRNSLSSSQNLDFSDSSLETESYLKPTQNIISSLQARLSMDSDQDSDYEQHRNYAVALNNETKNLIKNKPMMHVRHNSFDDRNVKMPNKLEHFHQKNLQQGIDQTFKTCNQYPQINKTVHRIQNSPNNSPIRRSSSFSLKNQFDNQPKCLNTSQTNKDSNLGGVYSSPNFQQRNGSGVTVQRSASTANIKPNIEIRRSSITLEQKPNKPQYLDTTESSSDEDFDKTITKNKKDLTTTRYNRAFSLRRARLDDPAPPAPRCPNTPEMRRKFAPSERERTVSVDRKTAARAAPDVQSRYMNIASKSAKNSLPSAKPVETPKSAPKVTSRPPSSKPPVFSRTDTGRFSMRAPKPSSAAPKPMRRDQGNYFILSLCVSTKYINAKLKYLNCIMLNAFLD